MGSEGHHAQPTASIVIKSQEVKAALVATPKYSHDAGPAGNEISISLRVMQDTCTGRKTSFSHSAPRKSRPNRQTTKVGRTAVVIETNLPPSEPLAATSGGNNLMKTTKSFREGDGFKTGKGNWKRETEMAQKGRLIFLVRGRTEPEQKTQSVEAFKIQRRCTGDASVVLIKSPRVSSSC